MIRNYLKTALRNFLRQRSYSFINVSGLAIGLACSIFILLWVMDEINFDNFHQDKDRIFQIRENQTYSEGKIFTFSSTPGPLAEGLKMELPEVEQSCRTTWNDRILFKFEDQAIYEEGLYADSTLFKIFTFSVVEGNRNNPLPDNSSVAISQKMAAKYFKTESAIGKIFKLNNKTDAKVTAVFQDIPENSSIRFEFIAPFELYLRDNQWLKDWGNNGIQTYVKLYDGKSRGAVDKKIKEFVKKRNEGSVVDLFLFPLPEWRLYNNFEAGKQAGGRITYVRAFGTVAVFILLIACINFMNLATARSANRSKEVGVRKVVGAQRGSLIRQFIGESLLVSFLSLILALLMVHSLMPLFNDLTGKKIGLDYANPLISGSLIGITLLTGLVAGSYPAFFLSSFRPASVLKGNLQSALSGAGLRKVLVVFQFGLSVVLIISALVVYDQIRYIRNKNLGFDRENVFYFSRNDGIRKSFESFRSESLQNPAIRFVAEGNQNPMEVGNSSGDPEWDGKTKDDQILFSMIYCDYEYLPALGFSVLEGRNFSREFATDSSNFIITEETARRMRLTHPIAQRLKAQGKQGQIIGVAKDFHSTSLHAAIEPVIFILSPENSWRIFVRYAPGKVEEAVNHIKTVYKKFEPNFPLEYDFLDVTFERQYRSEIMVGRLSTCFMVMAIFISCLGLFGLASFTTERRAKEIGVRKVLGASTGTLVIMLCRDFAVLILFSIVLGCPLAYYLMLQFLKQYTFHTELSVGVFVLTGFIMVGIALLTVSYQSARAALGNPVDALRSE